MLRPLLRAYAVCFPIWIVVGLFFLTQDLTKKFLINDPTPWRHYLASWCIGACLNALVTPAILWLGTRYPIEKPYRFKRTLLHLVWSVIFAFGVIAAESVTFPWLGLFPTMMTTPGITFWILATITFHQNFLTYWTIHGIGYSIRFYRAYQERKQHALQLELESSELKTQIVRAQLSALNMQLQPHFLFNTLNAIVVLVRQRKAQEAETMLGRLSDLLRCVLEDVNSQEVPLSRELDYLRLYLSIEEVRFQDRLQVEISADPDALEAAIPHLGLQPIVENAIRHGIGKSSSAGRIRIAATHCGDSLEIRVHDDGPGVGPGIAAQGQGIGLTNTRERLRRLYGDQARLTIENDEPRGAVVTITLPYRLPKAPDMMEVNAVSSPDRG